MSDIDTLLRQALALVNEDRREQLADIIEQIITQAQAAPTPDWLQAARDWSDALGDYDFIRGDPTAPRQMIEEACQAYQWRVEGLVLEIAKFDPPVDWPALARAMKASYAPQV